MLCTFLMWQARYSLLRKMLRHWTVHVLDVLLEVEDEERRLPSPGLAKSDEFKLIKGGRRNVISSLSSLSLSLNSA